MAMLCSADHNTSSLLRSCASVDDFGRCGNAAYLRLCLLHGRLPEATALLVGNHPRLRQPEGCNQRWSLVLGDARPVKQANP